MAKEVHIIVDIRVSQCQMNFTTNFEARLIGQMKRFRQAGYSLSVSYFARPNDVVINPDYLAFVWQEEMHSVEELIVRVAHKDCIAHNACIAGKELINIRELPGIIQSSQEQGEICLLVSPDSELREEYEAKNCVTLKVSHFGEFMFLEMQELQGNVHVYQDTDDTTILRLFSWVRQACFLNPNLELFYERLLEKYSKEQIFVRQITSRRMRKEKASVYSKTGGEKEQLLLDTDTPEIKQGKNFSNSVRMEVVMTEVASLCQKL